MTPDDHRLNARRLQYLALEFCLSWSLCRMMAGRSAALVGYEVNRPTDYHHTLCFDFILDSRNAEVYEIYVQAAEEVLQALGLPTSLNPIKPASDPEIGR